MIMYIHLSFYLIKSKLIEFWDYYLYKYANNTQNYI